MNPVDELNLKLGIGPRRPALPKELVLKGYTSIKQIGKGAFGSAILIFNEKKKQYSIAKEVVVTSMSDQQRKEAQNEVDILSSLHHPNIIRYEECHSNSDKILIIMEYADGGDLDAKIRAKKAMHTVFRPAEAAKIFSQTALAIKYLHDRHILHRDLKTQNVFLTAQGVVKLGDFGISTVLQNSVVMAKTICGTPFYFSPELCQGHAYNNKSDIWALGCLLYEVLTLDVPFVGSNMTDLMKKIVNEPLSVPPAVDGRWEELLQAMMQKDFQKRPGIDEVCRNSFLREQFSRLASEFDKQAADFGKGDAGSAQPSPRASPPSPAKHNGYSSKQGGVGAAPPVPDAGPTSPERQPIAGRRKSLPSASPPPPARDSYHDEQPSPHHGSPGSGADAKKDTLDLGDSSGPLYGRRSPKVREHQDSVKIRKQKLENARVANDSGSGMRKAVENLDFVLKSGGLRTVVPEKQQQGPGPSEMAMPEQPHNPTHLRAEAKNLADFIRSIQERDIPSKTGPAAWGDDWCTGYDLASPEAKDDAGGVRIGGDTLSWANPLDGAGGDDGGDGGGGGRTAGHKADLIGTLKPDVELAATTIEVRLAAAQALIATLTSDLDAEKGRSEKLLSTIDELRARNMTLTEENLGLKRSLRGLP